MSMELTIVLVVVCCLILLLCYILHLKNPPPENYLKNATLFSNEEMISCTDPVHLVGIPDLVYETHDGYLYVVDIKTRRDLRVYYSDVIQISVYALILATIHGRDKVLRTGYILLKKNRDDVGKYVRLELLTEEEVCKLYDRFIGIENSSITAKLTTEESRCKVCPTRVYCQRFN